MSRTLIQGWDAPPIAEQFPELSPETASMIDRLNMSVFDMLMADLITDSQHEAIRKTKFPRLVGKALADAADKAKAVQS